MPRVHQPSRTKTTWNLVGCLAFVAISGWLLAIDTYSRAEDVTFTHRVLWREIEEVKLLQIQYPGRVVEGLRIHYGNVALETNESHEGYNVLAERLKANLPGMPRDWQLRTPTGTAQQTEKTLWRKTSSSS